MSHALIIRRRAEHDMAEAGLWFESRRPGTALYFIRCVDASIALITRHPAAGPVQFGPFRRILVSRFPFGVFYTISSDTVIVHGVFHSSRDPNHPLLFRSPFSGCCTSDLNPRRLESCNMKHPAPISHSAPISHFLVSFTGIVTFKNAAMVQETARDIAGDRFMVETDCPFLAPAPHRGKRCEPAQVWTTAQHIAGLRGESLDALAARTTATAEAFFRFSK